jgi:hypothetical protein
LKAFCEDRHSRPALIDLDLFATFDAILKAKKVKLSWRLHILDCMKPFFGSSTPQFSRFEFLTLHLTLEHPIICPSAAKYQALMLEKGLFRRLMELITSSDDALSSAAFDLLRYFDGMLFVPVLPFVPFLSP